MTEAGWWHNAPENAEPVQIGREAARSAFDRMLSSVRKSPNQLLVVTSLLEMYDTMTTIVEPENPVWARLAHERRKEIRWRRVRADQERPLRWLAQFPAAHT